MKYCANCGCKLGDDAKFCFQCGAAQEQYGQAQSQMNQQGQYGQAQSQASQYGQGQSQPSQYGQAQSQMNQQGQYGQAQSQQGQYGQAQSQPNQQAGYAGVWPTAAAQPAPAAKNTNRIVGIAAVVVVALLVVVVVKGFFGAGSGNGSVEKAVKAYYQALTDKDGEDYLNICFSSALYDAVVEESGYSETTFVAVMNDTLATQYEDFGKVKNIDISYIEAADSSEVEQFAKALESEFGVEVEISAAQELSVSFQYYDTEVKEWKDDDEMLILYKSGSKWYVLSEDMF